MLLKIVKGKVKNEEWKQKYIEVCKILKNTIWIDQAQDAAPAESDPTKAEGEQSSPETTDPAAPTGEDQPKSEEQTATRDTEAPPPETDSTEKQPEAEPEIDNDPTNVENAVKSSVQLETDRDQLSALEVLPPLNSSTTPEENNTQQMN